MPSLIATLYLGKHFVLRQGSTRGIDDKEEREEHRGESSHRYSESAMPFLVDMLSVSIPPAGPVCLI